MVAFVARGLRRRPGTSQFAAMSCPVETGHDSYTSCFYNAHKGMKLPTIAVGNP